MNKEKKGGRASLAVAIILCVIFIPIILLNSVLIIKTYVNKGHLPDIFGIKPAIVTSGSMSPVFEPKALIFIKETDPSTLKEGDIICFLEDGTAVTHRIQEIIVSEDGKTAYITKGDANNTPDHPIGPEQVEGKYIGKISGVGGFVMFLQSTAGMILFIVVPILLYLAFDIFSRRRERMWERKRAAALEAELNALKAERDEKAAAEAGNEDPPPRLKNESCFVTWLVGHSGGSVTYIKPGILKIRVHFYKCPGIA